MSGLNIKELRYADDLVLMALSRKHAEDMLAILGDISEEYGLVIHPGKTEYLVIQKVLTDSTITFRGAIIPRVSKFRYLGTTITQNLNDSEEVRIRIGIGKAALRKCKYLASSLVQSLVIAKVLYNSITLTFKAADLKRFDAFGRMIWRTLLGIKWSDFITNERLAELIGGRWCLTSDEVLERKAKWCAHVMRQGGLPGAAIDGLPTGTVRGRGRPKLCWIDNVTEWSGRSVKEPRREAIERHQVMAATPGVRHHYNLRTRRPRTQVYAE